jgi:hypothetical protein
MAALVALGSPTWQPYLAESLLGTVGVGFKSSLLSLLLGQQVLPRSQELGFTTLLLCPLASVSLSSCPLRELDWDLPVLAFPLSNFHQAYRPFLLRCQLQEGGCGKDV